jgi:23S rRNA (cytidine1920-2'-O)/16S rRNA (cytidine1409-2'-O)-methyltransferase
LKIRLDKFLSENRFTESREKAVELIKAGFVKVNGETIKKPSFKVSLDDEVILDKKFPYVSRAGLKLERALNIFNLSPKNKICLDIGASTGGFTDCLLKFGANKVYAVDTGTNQLHPILKENPQVISMEKTNARYLTKHHIPEKVEFLVCDVSFISVLKILPNLKELLSSKFDGVVLIKPQFELSKQELKKGVVKKKEHHIKAIKKVLEGLKNVGYGIVNLDFSMPFGTDGNIEFIAHINFSENFIKDDTIKFIVDKAHIKYNEEKDGSSGLSQIKNI